MDKEKFEKQWNNSSEKIKIIVVSDANIFADNYVGFDENVTLLRKKVKVAEVFYSGIQIVY